MPAEHETMKRIAIPMRLAAAFTAAALAGCGSGGDADRTPETSPASAVVAGTEPVPAPSAAPTPAAPQAGVSPDPDPASSAAPTPAPPTVIEGDAVRGKQLYADLPNTTLSCEGCHGAAIDNVSNILSAAGDWKVIARAIAAGRGGMDALAFPVLTGFDMQDIAAYLAQPTR